MIARPGRRVFAWSVAALLIAAPALPAVADGIDFIVFSDADGRLGLQKPTQVDEPYPILPGSREDLPGFYLSIEPGWDGLGVSDVPAGQLALADGAEIVLRRVEFDPGFTMFNLDFEPILESEGAEETLAGEPEADEFVWHEHLVFGIEAGEPLEKEFSATFVASDASGQHADSEPFTLRFVTAAQPVVANPGGPARGGLCGALGMIMPLVTFGLMGVARLAARFRIRPAKPQ